MKIVEDAHAAWRWHSTQIFAAIAALPLVWTQLPPDVRAMVPDAWHPWIIAGMAVAGLVGRLRAQPK